MGRIKPCIGYLVVSNAPANGDTLPFNFNSGHINLTQINLSDILGFSEQS